MSTYFEIFNSLDQVVNDLLEQAEIIAPPVNSFQIARELGWEIVLNEEQCERGRYKRIQNQPTIFLKPDDRPERVHWALAHELGETLSDRWKEWIEEQDTGSSSSSPRESLANLFATRLLLPECWFSNEAVRLEGDLTALKESFSTASYQLIAYRLLDVESPLMVTIFDQGKPTSRRCNWTHSPPPLQAAEKACWEKTHSENRYHSAKTSELQLDCWPVQEPDWKREILCTRPLDQETF
ncbi:MAG: ImmA/IrrE family metallo-endopeptidase [Planctomycetaceae bacterium]